MFCHDFYITDFTDFFNLLDPTFKMADEISAETEPYYVSPVH